MPGETCRQKIPVPIHSQCIEKPAAILKKVFVFTDATTYACRRGHGGV